MMDVGLHLDTQKLVESERLAPADLEARKRLYHSAYIWDKTLGLSLGRPPSPTRLPHAIDDMLDDLDDQEELWKPVCLAGIQDTYCSVPSYNISTFRNICRLGEIITMILATAYNRDRLDAISDGLQSLESRLHKWYDNLPEVLRINDAKRLGLCPPPHILSLNLLYHTLLIIVSPIPTSFSITFIKSQSK